MILQIYLLLLYYFQSKQNSILQCQMPYGQYLGLIEKAGGNIKFQILNIRIL